MNRRVLIAVLVIVLSLSILIYKAATTTAKAVVTVGELLNSGNTRNNIRLAARVTEDPIEQSSSGIRKFSFYVRDIVQSDGKKLKIISEQSIPDTLRAGRDVILEGNFNDQEFFAKSLMTQCPSKYEPPKPKQGI